MPATTNGTKPQAPPKETWADWQSPASPEPEPLLTRAELVERVRADGFDVTERVLAYWEHSGVLPRAVRRWRDGKPAALYPQWAVSAVVTIRIMQTAGESLDLIRCAIRGIYHRPLSEDERRPLADAYFAATKELTAPMRALARQWARWNGQGVDVLKIYIRGDDGATSVLDFSIAAQRATNRGEINDTSV